MAQLGFCGLGVMGYPMAGHLSSAGHSVTVYNRTIAKADAWVGEHGGSSRATPRDVAAASDIVMLCVGNDDDVRSVVFGADGVLAGAHSGMILVDHTTTSAELAREISAACTSAGVGFIDAPVSGGAKGAEAGTIAIMVGAGDDQFARIQPLLASISPNIFHAGDVGAGQVIKLVNNLMSASYRLLAFEGLALAHKNGIDPQRACDILLAGGGRSQYVQKFLEPQVIKGNLHVGFTLGLMLKDVRLACKLGSDSGVPMFLGNQVRELYQMCANENGFDAQVDTAALVIDRMAGTHIVPEGVTLESTNTK